jgi:phosphoribosylformylglycinamidine (FGAM) synthase-like enzyme
VAAAEMAFAGDLGLRLDLQAMPAAPALSSHARAFCECPSRYLLEVEEANLTALRARLGSVPHAVIGRFDPSGTLSVAGEQVPVSSLREAWNRGGEGW